jgi:hypothetical protein
MLCHFGNPNFGQTVNKFHSFSLTGKSCQTFTRVSRNGVLTNPAIVTGRAHTIVDVDLTVRSRKANRTSAFERVDQIVTDASVQTRVGSTLVNVCLTLSAGETWK